MQDKAKVAKLLTALKAKMTTVYELSVVEKFEIFLNEEWQDIEGYEGLYKVSNLEKIRKNGFGKSRSLL